MREMVLYDSVDAANRHYEYEDYEEPEVTDYFVTYNFRLTVKTRGSSDDEASDNGYDEISDLLYKLIKERKLYDFEMTDVEEVERW